MALADDSSPVFPARAMDAVGAFYTDIESCRGLPRQRGAGLGR